MSLHADVRKAVHERDDYTCRYCGQEITRLREWWEPPFGRGRWMGLIHVDHVIPRSRGGTDDLDNLVTACRDCNLTKYTNQWEPIPLMPADQRRSPWVPLSSEFAHGRTGLALKHRFGRDGLLVWVCYLAACKTNWIQGQLTYSAEAEGWQRLGLYEDPPEFTLKAFFTYTGQLKQTSRRQSGEVTDIVCTHWGDWNKTSKRALEAEKKRWKRADITRTLDPLDSDSDSDSDIESDSDSPLPLKNTTPDTIPDRLLGEIRDADGRTAAAFQTLQKRLPAAAFATALESLKERRRRSDRAPLVSEARYVVAALTTMEREGQYR